MTHTLRSLLVAAVCLLPSLGQAATVTLNPTADAYVQNGANAAKNYGTATTLRVQSNATAASNYDSYLKFDTTSAAGPVTSAKLRVYAKLAKAGNVTSTASAVADTIWGETSLTWNNKPAPGSSLGSISVTSTGYAWKEIDVTPYIQSERSANRNVVSFVYRAAASSLLTTLQSREGANKPQLVLITAANVAPSVSLTAPATGASYTAPANISLSATAADSDGSITQVAFYNGATLIGSATSTPYTFTWSNVAAGSYSLTAKATDNAGAVTTSTAVSISVTSPPPPPPSVSLYYLYADHLNTPRVATDSTNKVVWRWDSDAFGTSTANEDPDGDGVKFTYNPRFPGQYFDKETNLHYNYFRDYEPGTGRYVQSDPIGLAGGLNVYNYALNNPLSFTDPTGQFVFLLPAIPAAAAALGQAAVFVGSAAIAGYGLSKLCEDDPECSMASGFQLIQAGITSEHAFKEEYVGKKNGSRYDICACKDGSIKIAGRKQCGSKGPKIDTYARWK